MADRFFWVELRFSERVEPYLHPYGPEEMYADGVGWSIGTVVE